MVSNRLTKIYTGTGDKGTTSLADGTRVDKSALRVEVMGDVDELNSLIGLVISHDIPDKIAKALQTIQHILFNLGGELSIPGAAMIKRNHGKLLEQEIDEFNESLPPLKEFVLPDGNRAAASCHVARSVCRRAERKLVQLGQTGQINQYSLVFLNRLSDLLFVIARVLTREEGGEEIYWDKNT